MKLHWRLMGLIFVMPGCNAQTPVPAAGNEASEPPEAVEQLRKDALAGDDVAALRLSAHFAVGENDTHSGYFWMRLAAERDHCHALREMVKWDRSRFGADSPAVQRWNARLAAKPECAPAK